MTITILSLLIPTKKKFKSQTKTKTILIFIEQKKTRARTWLSVCPPESRVVKSLPSLHFCPPSSFGPDRDDDDGSDFRSCCCRRRCSSDVSAGSIVFHVTLHKLSSCYC